MSLLVAHDKWREHYRNCEECRLAALYAQPGKFLQSLTCQEGKQLYSILLEAQQNLKGKGQTENNYIYLRIKDESDNEEFRKTNVQDSSGD